MQVQQCMRTPAVTCSPGAKLVEVARQMEWEDVGSVVVVDDDGGIRGVVTDRDLAMTIARELSSTTPVSEAIARPPIVIHDHEDVYDAASKMAAARCRRLPVVNAAGKLVGVVAIDDVIGAFSHRTETISVGHPAS